MNAFFEHHQRSIRLSYRCFDRLLLNGLIQPFQQPERSQKWNAPILEARRRVDVMTSWTPISSAPRPMKSSPS